MRLYCFLLMYVGFVAGGNAQSSPSHLFTESTPLTFQLEGDLHALKGDRGTQRKAHPAVLRFGSGADTGWAAMTDSELAVARLVAQGLTNREVAEQLFVSPHTVSSHLRSVFAKLEITSRAQLRDALPAITDDARAVD